MWRAELAISSGCGPRPLNLVTWWDGCHHFHRKQNMSNSKGVQTDCTSAIDTVPSCCGYSKRQGDGLCSDWLAQPGIARSVKNLYRNPSRGG